MWEERWRILDADDVVEAHGGGGVRTAGESVRWAAAFGDPTWAGLCSPSCNIKHMVLGSDELGAPIVALAGWQSGSDNDPFVMLLEADAAWSNWSLRDAHAFRFADQSVSTNRADALAALADGGFVLVGRSDTDVGVDQLSVRCNLQLVKLVSPRG